MEFKTGNYDTRLILNPTDLIIRFEHSDTHRIYERTFFERDFVDYIILGGIEFIGRVLNNSLNNQTPILTETPSELNLSIPFTHSFISKTLTLQFRIPSIRREKGGVDIEDMSNRLKKMEESIVLCRTLSTRIEELEERCGNTITLLGCDYAIPVDITQLILVRNNSMLPDGRRFSSWYPGMYHAHPVGSSEYNLNQPTMYQGGHVVWTPIPPNEKAFTFHTLTSITNLKYLKKLTHLTICGSAELLNYEAIGELQNLQNLLIVSNMTNQLIGGITWQYFPKDNHPQLKDIRWISNLKKLVSISFQGSSDLINVAPLKGLPSLTLLNIKNTGVKNTAFLENSTLKIEV